MLFLRLFLLLLSLTGIALSEPEWTWVDIEGNTQAPFADTNTAALVIVFIDVQCPVANYFHPTLRRIATDTRERGARFLFVHPDPDVTKAEAQKHAKAFKVAGPVVLDAKQATARRLLADVTPEAFVMSPDGKVHYRGRVNDMFVRPAKKRVKPRTHDLRDALEAVLAGKKVETPETTAVGCYIFFDPPLEITTESQPTQHDE